MGIKHFICLLVMGLIMISCGSLKKSKQFQQQVDEAETTNHLRLTEQGERTLTAWRSDSADKELRIEITPIGRFTYSAENGFKGQATQVTITGKQSSRILQLGTETTRLAKQKETSASEKKMQMKKQEKATQSGWRIPVWLWIGLAIFCLLGGLMLRQKWRAKGYLLPFFG